VRGVPGVLGARFLREPLRRGLFVGLLCFSAGDERIFLARPPIYVRYGRVWYGCLVRGAGGQTTVMHGDPREGAARSASTRGNARVARAADSTGRRKVAWRVGSVGDAQHAALERATLQAIKDLWPGGEGMLTSAALLAHLAERGVATPARALYLLLESLQMRGSLRLSRGNPDNAAREAHGARHIRWVNPALLDSPPA
jgi:hypothetical protein